MEMQDGFFYRRVQLLKDLSYELAPQSTILDFGCAAGETVLKLRSNGYDAYGCDIYLPSNVDATLIKTNHIRLIHEMPYRIPFDDNAFDLVFSWQVLEHVQNYESVFSEFNRVLKPGGVGLHIFPPRYALVEAHTFIPLGGVMQRNWWLAIWAFLGIRNSYQENLSVKEVIERNFRYLHTKTNYLTKSQITYYVNQFFGEYKFCELLALKHSSEKFLYRLLRYLPFMEPLLSSLGSRVLFIGKTPKS